MKKIVAFTAVALCVSSAFAQEFNSSGYDRPYNNQAYAGATSAYAGATSQGASSSQRVMGRIDAAYPITRSFPAGQVCHQPPEGRVQPQSAVNPGTIIGAIVGGIALNQVGGGNGKTIATALGTATGALVGNDYYQSRSEQGQRQSSCETTFEQRIVGWNYTATYNGLQVQGTMQRQPRVGEDVQLIMSSTLQAAQ